MAGEEEKDEAALEESAAGDADSVAPTGEAVEGRFPLVGVVASAGGLDAFRKFFSGMPGDSGLGFVLVPHLDPARDSLMVELIARSSAMPVVEATHDAIVEPDHVYVLPPNRYMTIEGGKLR